MFVRHVTYVSDSISRGPAVEVCAIGIRQHHLPRGLVFPLTLQKECGNFPMPFMLRPPRGSGAPKRVSRLGACPAIEEELHEFEIARARSLMQWRGMGMPADGMV